MSNGSGRRTARRRSGTVAVVSALAAALVADAAAAETWQPIRSDGDWRGTLVCVADPATGERLCFGLRCQPGQPMQWLLQPGGRPLPATGRVTVDIDGAATGSFDFTATRRGGGHEATAPFFSVPHAGIAEALARGRSASLAVTGIAGPVVLPLAGAARQIERTFRLCGVPRGAPSRPM